MKISLHAILLLCLTLHQTTSLFSNSSVSNFSITGIIEPNKITLDSTGQKFIVWNNNAQIRMYNTNGTLICFNSFVKQIQDILWPENYPPILLSYPGQQFSTLDETSCTAIKTYNILKFMNISSKTQILEMTFVRINEIPYIAASTMGALYPIDLNSESSAAIFTTFDPTLPRYGENLFSNDLKNLYIVMIDSLTGTRYVRVWNTNQTTGKPFTQIQFPTSVVSMTASNDNKSIICVGSYMNNNITNVYRFEKFAQLKIKASRQQIGKSISIGEGNVVLMFKNEEGSMEVIRTGDGKSIQNITYTTVTDFYDADYKNKVLIILDGMGRVITYSYEPDEDVQPTPDPETPDEGFPLWIVIVAAGAGLLIIMGIIIFVMRKKKSSQSYYMARQEKDSLISNKVASEYEYRPAVERRQDDPRRSIVRMAEERRQEDPRRSIARMSEKDSVHGDEQAPVYVPPPLDPKESFRAVVQEQPKARVDDQKVQKRNFFAVKNEVYDDSNSQFKCAVEEE